MIPAYLKRGFQVVDNIFVYNNLRTVWDVIWKKKKKGKKTYLITRPCPDKAIWSSEPIFLKSGLDNSSFMVYVHSIIHINHKNHFKSAYTYAYRHPEQHPDSAQNTCLINIILYCVAARIEPPTRASSSAVESLKRVVKKLEIETFNKFHQHDNA